MWGLVGVLERGCWTAANEPKISDSVVFRAGLLSVIRLIKAGRKSNRRRADADVRGGERKRRIFLSDKHFRLLRPPRLRASCSLVSSLAGVQ